MSLVRVSGWVHTINASENCAHTNTVHIIGCVTGEAGDVVGYDRKVQA